MIVHWGANGKMNCMRHAYSTKFQTTGDADKITCIRCLRKMIRVLREDLDKSVGREYRLREIV